MGWIDGIKSLLAIEPMQPLQERTVDPFTAAPTMAAQIAAIRNTQAQARPWRLPSISEALGFPAILRAVTLISNTTGSLAIQGWCDEMPMAKTPRIITRPDPFRTPQEAYRDMAWAMSTRGETILWIAARDYNDQPLTLIVVPLAEVTVEENPRNRLYPTYQWGNVKSTRYSPANPSRRRNGRPHSTPRAVGAGCSSRPRWKSTTPRPRPSRRSGSRHRTTSRAS